MSSTKEGSYSRLTSCACNSRAHNRLRGEHLKSRHVYANDGRVLIDMVHSVMGKVITPKNSSGSVTWYTAKGELSIVYGLYAGNERIAKRLRKHSMK